jgi:CheY-like chemotaxis protein
MNILLLEPDVILARITARALEIGGHKVVLSTTAQTGIFAADTAMPDLIILELQLVSHSGIEFLYELRSYGEWQHIPVIIHSHIPPGEFSGSGDLFREQLGVRAYHYKPRTSLKKLLRSIAEVVPATV